MRSSISIYVKIIIRTLSQNITAIFNYLILEILNIDLLLNNDFFFKAEYHFIKRTDVVYFVTVLCLSLFLYCRSFILMGLCFLSRPALMLLYNEDFLHRLLWRGQIYRTFSRRVTHYCVDRRFESAKNITLHAVPIKKLF